MFLTDRDKMCILYIPSCDRYVFFLFAWWNLHVKVVFYGSSHYLPSHYLLKFVVANPL